MDVNVVAYKCPSCNAPLSFSAETQDFACEYCLGHFSKEELDSAVSSETIEPVMDMDGTADSNFESSNNLYVCPTCGAAVMTDSELSASAECHYCHSPVVLSGRLTGEFCPRKIIPFKKTKQNALEGFEEWTKKKKFFMAKGFGSPEALEKIQGIYVPYWLADCCVDGQLTVDIFKTVSSVRKGDYIVKTEERFTCKRAGSLIFQGVPADGSSKADDKLMESIEPFNYDEMVDFNMSYLSGHNAEKYDVSKESVYPRIKERIINEAEAEFKKTIAVKGRMVTQHKNFRVTNINWKYVMLPMWFLSYTYKGKMYYYAMNGQTGAFGGIIPVNKLKLGLFGIGIPVAIGLLFLIAILFGGFLG